MDRILIAILLILLLAALPMRVEEGARRAIPQLGWNPAPQIEPL
jgi:hypothetical protein